MTDIINLFERLTLEDNIDDIINDFSKISISDINDEKEIDDIITGFDRLTLNKQQQCMSIIYNHNHVDNIRVFLDKIGYILMTRYNTKCYIEHVYTNNNMVNI